MNVSRHGFFASLVLTFVSCVVNPTTSRADEFPSIYNSERQKTAEPMPAEQAAATMKLPEGFTCSVFAAEPDVMNPIAMTWDGRGRLWIAENFTYAERSQRFDLSLKDRVIVLEDFDNDGRADKRTVFTDQVQMLTSVEYGHGGVWLMCPPKLLFIPDADRDDVPDGPPVVKLDGFTVAEHNYHNFANGLRWGPDGWLYGRCGGSCPGEIGKPGTPDDERVPLRGGIWRYHPTRETVEVLCSGTCNPWGHDWNEEGELFFINTVNGHLWHLIPGAHYTRPFTVDPRPYVYELIDTHSDHYHFDTGQPWHKSRGGTANDFGGGHAHQGCAIYHAPLSDDAPGTWPEKYHGRLFTVNLHGRRINVERLDREGSGYVGRHEPDFLLAEDPFFRGLDMRFGPDGQMYLIDWSDTGECHEHDGVHRTSGRVYRIAYNGAVSGPRVKDIRERSISQLAMFAISGDQWLAQNSRLALIEQVSERLQPPHDKIGEALAQVTKDILRDGPLSKRQANQIYTAYEQIDVNLWMEQATHRAIHDSLDFDALRIRLRRLYRQPFTLDHRLDTVLGNVHWYNQLPEINYGDNPLGFRRPSQTPIGLFFSVLLADPNQIASCHLEFACALQRMPVCFRSEFAAETVCIQRQFDDHNLPLMVWYGLIPVADQYPEQLVDVVDACTWPRTGRLITRRLTEMVDEKPQPLAGVLDVAIAKADKRDWVIAGMEQGLEGVRKATPPENWDAFVRAIENSDDESLIARVQKLSVVFGDGRALDDVRQVALSDGDIIARQAALRTLINARDPQLRDVCQKLLRNQRLNVLAAEGLALFDEPKIATTLIDNYRRFRSPDQPQIIALLVARPSFVGPLLEAIAAKKIPRDHLTAYHVRQIHTFDDAALSQRVGEVWGELRESSAEKQALIDALKTRLTPAVLAKADLPHGRLLYSQSCGKCHQLFGDGGKIGPALTGSNRSNMHYLTENIVDPSAVVSKDYRMTVVVLGDGRVLNGLVTAQTDKTLTLETPTATHVIALDDIDERKTTSLSPMPEGLLDQMSDDDVRDLFAYLQAAAQVPLP